MRNAFSCWLKRLAQQGTGHGHGSSWQLRGLGKHVKQGKAGKACNRAQCRQEQARAGLASGVEISEIGTGSED